MKNNFCVFSIEHNGLCYYYRDNNCTDAAELLKRYADVNGYMPDFTKSCERISESDFADLSQNYSPAFTAEINVDNNEITVYRENDENPSFFCNLDEYMKDCAENEIKVSELKEWQDEAEKIIESERSERNVGVER